MTAQRIRVRLEIEEESDAHQLQYRLSFSIHEVAQGGYG
jgi:hypothetical protein